MTEDNVVFPSESTALKFVPSKSELLRAILESVSESF